MLKMTAGCKIPNPELLCEQYSQNESEFYANVNADNVESVFQHFICMQSGKLFLILELPANEEEERHLRRDDHSPLHQDIYYIDGLDREDALLLLSRCGELLIQDGMSRFGFGVQDNSAELMLGKYNVMTLWTDSAEKYDGFFEAHGIPRAKKIMTAWDTFSAEGPGECTAVRIDGKTVFDLPSELKDWGIYLAEQREEQ